MKKPCYGRNAMTVGGDDRCEMFFSVDVPSRSSSMRPRPGYPLPARSNLTSRYQFALQPLMLSAATGSFLAHGFDDKRTAMAVSATECGALAPRPTLPGNTAYVHSSSPAEHPPDGSTGVGSADVGVVRSSGQGPRRASSSGVVESRTMFPHTARLRCPCDGC